MKKKLIIWLVSISIGICGCTQEKQKEEQQDKNKNTVIALINDEEIDLREWNFYIRMNQMQWEKSYLDSYGDEMWDRELGEDGETMADRLKKDTFNSIVRTHLLNQYAKDYEVELSEEQKQDIKNRAEEFMEAYHPALLEFAGAEEEFVYEKLSEKELGYLVYEACAANYEPQIPEEDYHREGICYVLISTTGLRDNEGVLTPFSEEEVARRTQLAKDLCQKAKESGNLKEAAEAEGLTPVEGSVGNDNTHDSHEPLMLNAARELEVGEISEPIQTEEGWFLVQHTSDYDEEGVEYWKEYLTELARGEKAEEIYEQWEEEAEIITYEENMDLVNVKIVLKELL